MCLKISTMLIIIGPKEKKKLVFWQKHIYATSGRFETVVATGTSVYSITCKIE